MCLCPAVALVVGAALGATSGCTSEKMQTPSSIGDGWRKGWWISLLGDLLSESCACQRVERHNESQHRHEKELGFALWCGGAKNARRSSRTQPHCNPDVGRMEESKSKVESKQASDSKVLVGARLGSDNSDETRV